jgi:outer membrane protein assembly factor BamB
MTRSKMHLYLVVIVLAGTAHWVCAQTITFNAVSFQITTDHAGAAIVPGLNPPLSVKWSVDLGGTASYPLIAEGKVFVIGGGQTSTLYALDARTGATVWSVPVPANYGAWIGAAYENGKVFTVPNFTPQFDHGDVFAFSASTGQQLWMTDLPYQYLYSSAPTAKNGMVYTSGAGTGGTVYGVREIDGLLIWTANVENGDSSAPAVTSDGVYVSYVCPQSYRFNPSTGEQIWHYSGDCEGGGGASAAVYDGLVYVRDILDYPTDSITLSAADGSYVGGLNSQYSPAFWQNSGFYTEATSLTAVDLSSGLTLWTAMPEKGESYSCAPIVVNGVVYSGTSAGNLYGYTSDSGNKVFTVNLGQGISCSEYFPIPLAGLNAGSAGPSATRSGMLVVPAGSEIVALH